MVRVNKKYLDENLKISIWSKFRKEVGGAKNEKDFQIIIERFFTPAERIMIEKRLAIIILLERGLSYREIGKLIDVAPGTISFIKRGFKKKERVARKYSVSKNIPKKNKYSKHPTYIGKGRWSFLDNY